MGKSLWELFVVFARIGGLTFGGGYAMLPFLQKEIVEKRGWATEAQLMDYYAIGQCTPGIIAVNTATFVGYSQAGVAGGIAATLGVVSPSLVIIMAIAAFIRNFMDLAIVANAFAGIRVCVCVLVLNAVLKLRKSSVIDKPTLLIFAVALVLSAVMDISAILIVVLAGIVGLVVKKAEAKHK